MIYWPRVFIYFLLVGTFEIQISISYINLDSILFHFIYVDADTLIDDTLLNPVIAPVLIVY